MFLILRRTLVVAACIALGLSVSCSRSGLPTIDSKEYASTVSAFYVGLAGLQTGEDTRAKDKLTLATQLAPGEPAAWADLALLSAREQDFEKAAQYAEKAHSLAPGNSAIESLLGAISSKRGKLPEAIDHFKRAVALDGGNVKARQSLATEIERQSSLTSDQAAQTELEKLLGVLPGNVSVQLDIARLAAKRGDVAALGRMTGELDSESKDWPPEARERLALLERDGNGPNPGTAAVQAVFLRNLLVRVPAYRQSLDAVRTPAVFIADPFVGFIKLPTPDSRPAAPDSALTFTPTDSSIRSALWASALPLDDSGQVRILEAGSTAVTIRDGAQLQFAGPGAPGRNSVLAADLNYDFKSDIVLANAAGIRIYLQKTPSSFEDITSRSKISPAILKGSYVGAWAFDIDLDGDLDIILGAAQGEPVVLRNNGDSTFTVIRPFPQIKGPIAFASADLDGDGTPDIAMLDSSGAFHVLMNQRFGIYRERPLPDSVKGPNVAVAEADVNGDGTPDLVVLREDGALTRLSLDAGNEQWSTAQIAPAGQARLTPTTANLLLADFDNSGSIDILAGDGRIYLGDSQQYSEIRLPLWTSDQCGGRPESGRPPRPDRNHSGRQSG